MRPALASRCFAVAIAALALPAAAQTFEPVPPGPLGRDRTERPIEVSVSYSLSMPLKAEGIADQKAALEEGRRALYEIASKECVNILATIASTCKLGRLNIQSNAQRGPQVRDSVMVSATAAYQIQLK